MAAVVLHRVARSERPAASGGEPSRTAVGRIGHRSFFQYRILGAEAKRPKEVQDESGVLFGHRESSVVSGEENLLRRRIKASARVVERLKFLGIDDAGADHFRSEVAPTDRKRHDMLGPDAF